MGLHICTKKGCSIYGIKNKDFELIKSFIDDLSHFDKTNIIIDEINLDRFIDVLTDTIKALIAIRGNEQNIGFRRNIIIFNGEEIVLNTSNEIDKRVFFLFKTYELLCKAKLGKDKVIIYDIPFADNQIDEVFQIIKQSKKIQMKELVRKIPFSLEKSIEFMIDNLLIKVVENEICITEKGKAIRTLSCL